ncbi:hypothetical protein FA95DRAFT_1035525 [Auriscalpium vulgare]|uniref:Uncharacterized protein n=1 Tax=Auriscalpium vulgare TaxID=40419 RepID=A0ACB8RWR9_9AGAM|nr:hypothetical protein FA95DRAFT_1035525 [Auriscalpium vulgare]
MNDEVTDEEPAGGETKPLVRLNIIIMLCLVGSGLLMGFLVSCSGWVRCSALAFILAHTSFPSSLLLFSCSLAWQRHRQPTPRSTLVPALFFQLLVFTTLHALLFQLDPPSSPLTLFCCSLRVACAQRV